MGLFSFLFAKPLIITDDFFGEMKFFTSKKNDGHFECKKRLNFSENAIEIILDGTTAGPTEVQKYFISKIEDSYNEISKSIAPLIEDEFKNWKESFKILHFIKEFRPVFIQIPTCETNPVVWEIAFESDHDINHTFTVTMNGFKAKEVLIDG